MSFRLTIQTIDARELAQGLAHDQAGACVHFEGRVRNHNQGQAVASLEYEAHVELAEAEGRRIMAEAKMKFGLLAGTAVHRTGRLQIGDLAVWVGVAAAHRQPAFEACRYIIDELKARVPIWKKEHYASGTSTWINCAADRDGGGHPLPPGTRPAQDR